MLLAERLITYQGDAKRRKEPLSNQLKYNTMKVWLFYFLCYLRHEPYFWLSIPFVICFQQIGEKEEREYFTVCTCTLINKMGFRNIKNV